jgi:outer membrane receptor protein involved in Fe transport
MAVLGITPVWSQSGPGQGPAGALEEIIVTATKRQEAISDVPVAIQVYGADQLENFGITDFEDYAEYAPGVSFTKRGAGQTHIVMRGLSTGNVANAQPQNRSLVGIYFDDVPIQLNGWNFDPDLYDMARVEVLKGPQGTLFGDSAMAGAIRYVTTSPDLNEYAARINLTGSSTSHGDESYDARAMANLPLAEGKFGLRLVGWYRDDGGWIDNVRTGEDDVNDEDVRGGRVSALWRPTDAFSIQAMLLVQNSESGARPESEDELVGELRQDRDPEPFKDDAFMANLTFNYEFDQATLTSVTGYIDRDLENVNSLERLFLEFFGVDLPNNFLVDPWKQEYTTQELRLTSKGERKVDYTVGLFYAHQIINYPTFGSADGFAQTMVDFGIFPTLEDVYALGCAPPELPDHYFCGSLDTTQDQIAAFGDVTWHITDRFDLLIGARYYDWEQDFDENYGGFFNGGPTSKQQTIKEDGINPRFGATYSFGEDNMAFVNAAKGFRLGGVNDPLPDLCDADVANAGLTEVDKFESDELWTYETGVKLLLANRRWAFNSSVFYTDWDDVQTARQLDCGYVITQNAGKVISQGIEFDTTFAVTDNLRVMLSGSWTNAELDEDSQNLGASKGDRVPYVPEWKAALMMAYEFPLRDTWKGFANFAVSAQGESFTTFSEDDPARFEIPSQAVGNLRVGVEANAWRLTLFADNLWDERAVYLRELDNLDVKTWTYARPRTVGLELELDFK